MNMFLRMKAAIVRAAKRFDNWASGHTRVPPIVEFDDDDSLHPMNIPFDTRMCDRPPEGWMCTRPYGHKGPCAGVRLAESDSITASQWDKLKPHDSTHLSRNSLAPAAGFYTTGTQRRPLVLPDIQRSADEMRKPPRR